MGEPARRGARYEDLFDLPDYVVGEIIDGELIVSPRPRPKHANASSLIGMDVGNPYHRRRDDPDGPGGWWVLDEPELHLSEHILVPDLAGWRRERMPELPDDAYFALVPDWICEVLSPSTLRHDRFSKKRIYAREKVSHLWLVDPVAQTLEVLRREGEFWLETAFHQGDEKVRVEPFAEIEMNLARWWGLP